MRALNLALDDLTAMRKREGNSLRGDMMKKLDAIDGLRESIATRAPTVVEEYRAKLSQRLSALLSGDIDEARFATEVAIFADRAAIDEELVRLSSHIAQLRATAELDEPVGRKLDFLVQELNREVNTIGSKASDAQIAGVCRRGEGRNRKAARAGSEYRITKNIGGIRGHQAHQCRLRQFHILQAASSRLSGRSLRRSSA